MRRIVGWAVAGLSSMALLLGLQAIPAVAQSRAVYPAGQWPGAYWGGSSTVQHWGTFFGGTNTLMPEDTITSPASLTLPGPVAEVATSNSSQYALLTNGSVYAWGLGNAGQLGDGGTTNSFTTPVRVRFPAGVKIASLPIDVMPFDTALAVDTRGHVWGWGANQGGELCLGNHEQYLTPVRLPFSHVTAVAGAFDHALYDARGQVWACGLNSLGELGDGTHRPSSVPVKVKGLGRSAHVVSLVAAFANSGALLADGKYLDWGTNGEGQLGIGTRPRPSDVPVRVHLPARVRQITQGGSTPGNGQTLALLTNGDMYAWGADGQGQLGDGQYGVAVLTGTDHPAVRSHLLDARDERRYLVRHLQDRGCLRLGWWRGRPDRQRDHREQLRPGQGRLRCHRYLGHRRRRTDRRHWMVIACRCEAQRDRRASQAA